MRTLEVNHLSKSFYEGFWRPQKVTALNQVSLTLDESQIGLLSGPNGSGKTTLIKIISTLITPDEGSVKVCGLDLKKDSSRVRNMVGLVTNDDRSFFWRMSCYENLRFFCILNNLSEKVLKMRIENISHILHFDGFLHVRFDHCSSGIKRKLAIARALISRPRLILLDEPANSLDTESIESLKMVLREQVEKYAISVMYITHHPDELNEIVHRSFYLKEGHIIEGGQTL